MSSYGNYNNNHGYSGYGNNYRANNFKINEDDVPESKHAIFIRGLPANSMTFEQIKDFFEEKIGPCSFDFQKINQDRNLMFVAVRFETREAAKEAYHRYHEREEEVLGRRCDVSWFRDIKRFISYQAANGQLSRYQIPRNSGRFNQHNRQHDRNPRRYSEGRRSRSRSRSNSHSDRSRSRSRSKSRSRSRSGTWDKERKAAGKKQRDSKSRSVESLSEGERRSSSPATSRDSDRRPRSELKEDKKQKEHKKKAAKKEKRKRGRRSESGSSRSEGERSSESSGSDRENSRPPVKKKANLNAAENATAFKKGKEAHKGNGKDASPVSSAPSSPLRLVPPPSAPVIGPHKTDSADNQAKQQQQSGPLRKDRLDDLISTKMTDLARALKEDLDDEERRKRKERERNGDKRKNHSSKSQQKRRFSEVDEDVTVIEPVAKRSETDQQMRITIVNKPAAQPVPVESTAFKMALDSDEPPKRIIRPIISPPPPNAPPPPPPALVMPTLKPEKVVAETAPPPPAAVHNTASHSTSHTSAARDESPEIELRKATVLDPMERGGWRTVNADGSTTQLTQSAPTPAAPEPVHHQEAAFIDSPAKTPSRVIPPDNGDSMIPRVLRQSPAVGGPASSFSPSSAATTPVPAAAARSLPPKRPPPTGGSAAPTPPPPRSLLPLSMRNRCPEAAKLLQEAKFIQERVLATVRAESTGGLTLSNSLSDGIGDGMEKMEERERMLAALTEGSREKFDLKKHSLEKAFKNDCDTFGVVTRQLLAKDNSIEMSLRAALSETLEDMEKQLMTKLDTFLEMLVASQ